MTGLNETPCPDDVPFPENYNMHNMQVDPKAYIDYFNRYAREAADIINGRKLENNGPPIEDEGKYLLLMAQSGIAELQLMALEKIRAAIKS